MRIGHVHLKVRNLERAESFYSALLGAKPSERIAQQYSFLTFGEAHHDIALQQIGERGTSPSPASVGLYHTAFEVDTLDELKDVAKRLEDEKFAYVVVDHGISRAIYTSDPDGNGVEIFLDTRKRPGGSAEWSGVSRRLHSVDSGHV